MSIQADLLTLILKEFVNNKKKFRDQVAKMQFDQPDIDMPEPPARLHNKYNISKKVLFNRNIFIIENKSPITILYVHGGAYVHKLNKRHWWFIERLIECLNCNIVIPDYPLSPESNYKTTFEFMTQLLSEIEITANGSKTVFMGDSSGGGLTLALVEKMLRDNKKLPDEVILLSPWLDIRLNNPEISKYVDKDPLLDLESLRTVGKIYAAGTDLSSYLLSPINGLLKGLPPIRLFICTNDILFPDSQRAVKLCNDLDIPIENYIYNNLFHCWMLTKLPESENVLGKITNIINGKVEQNGNK